MKEGLEAPAVSHIHIRDQEVQNRTQRPDEGSEATL